MSTARFALCLLFLLAPPRTWAEEAQRSAAPAPAIKLEGGVDTYFALNLNRPADGANFTPGTGTTARRANEFSVNLASLGATVDANPVGFRLLLGWGTAMDVVHSGEPPGANIGLAVWHTIQQASASYTHGPLSVEAGIFPSHIGFEGFQSQSNWNYTRSWMAEYSVYYQTGVKAIYHFNSDWSAQLHLLNGWQIVGENNRGKAVGTQIAYSGERLAVTWNTFAGPETPNNNTQWRLFSDLYATLKVSNALSLAAALDAGLQPQPSGTAVVWYSGAAYARYELSALAAVSVRAEVFQDPGAAISGASQSLVEGTVTVELKPVDHLILKIEGRRDHSSVPSFSGFALASSGLPVLLQDQTLVTAGAVVYF